MKNLNPEKLAEDEIIVYNEAFEKFTETYQMHKEPMRSHLQKEYAQFRIECYIKYKNNNRNFYRSLNR
jgi:hypothetical protein